MAYNHENPNVNYEMGVWDYYINEVKTFNEKLDRYQEEVNQKLADQDSEIADFKLNVNNQIGTLRIQLADFERDLTQQLNTFEGEMNETFRQWTAQETERYDEQIAAFREQIIRINQNIAGYLDENLPTIIAQDQTLREEIITMAQCNVKTVQVTVRSDDSAEVTNTIILNEAPTTNVRLVGFDFDDAPVHSGLSFKDSYYHIANNEIYPKINFYVDGALKLAVTDRKPSGWSIGDVTYNVTYVVVPT